MTPPSDPLEIEIIVNGQSIPVWGLHAGMRIVATDYDPGKNKVTAWLEGTGVVPPSLEVDSYEFRP